MYVKYHYFLLSTVPKQFQRNVSSEVLFSDNGEGQEVRIRFTVSMSTPPVLRKVHDMVHVPLTAYSLLNSVPCNLPVTYSFLMMVTRHGQQSQNPYMTAVNKCWSPLICRRTLSLGSRETGTTLSMSLSSRSIPMSSPQQISVRLSIEL